MKYLISVLSGILILQIYISFSGVTASPVGVQKRTEETTLSSLSDDDLNDSQTEGLPAVTQPPQNARQDGDGDEESSTGGSASPSSSPAAVPLEGEDSDEGEDEESPAPTQAPPVTPTKRAPLPVQLNSTFGSEWSAVIANQNEFHTLKANQNQIDKLEQVQKETEALKIIEKGNTAPNETVVEKETETGTDTDTDSDKETEGADSDNENEADNEIARQGEAGGADTETETETGTGTVAGPGAPPSGSSPGSNSINPDENENDTDNEDEEDDDATTTATLTTTVVPPSSTIKYTSVIEEWAVVTGNVSDLPVKEIKTNKKNSADKINKDAVKPSSLDISSATFNSEWNAITGTGDVPATGGSSGTQKKTVDISKVSNDEGSAAVAVGATEKSTEPEDDEAEGQTAKPEETKTGTDTENEEEDEETQTEKVTEVTTKLTTKTKVNNTLSKETIKATTFEKEWAIVTGEEVLSDPQARASCECGKVPFAVPGGGVNEWPWTAAIVRNGFFAGGRPHCGATLINNKYALTSAHCVDGLLPDRFELWLTVHDNLQNSGSSSGTLKLPIDKILMHPNYQRHSHDNDIALIGLIDPINIGDNHYFVPACVPAGSNNYQGVMGKMAAWSTADLGKYGNRLSNNRLCRAEMPILSNDVCNRDTTHTGKITTNMLCAGYITPKPESNCVGDAGGGLVIANGGRHTLIGVTSFGYSPSRYSPTVHTRVSEYAEWILHNTRDADWCE